MGTNYYLYVDTCECCDRPDEIIHIGKKSFGWAFTIQGFSGHWERNETFSDYVKSIALPAILSWKDWKTIFKSMPKNWKIMDEYKRPMSKSGFIKLVEESYKDKKNKAHAKEYYSDNDVLDDQGYSISICNFS